LFPYDRHRERGNSLRSLHFKIWEILFSGGEWGLARERPLLYLNRGRGRSLVGCRGGVKRNFFPLLGRKISSFPGESSRETARLKGGSSGGKKNPVLPRTDVVHTKQGKGWFKRGGESSSGRIEPIGPAMIVCSGVFTEKGNV